MFLNLLLFINFSTTFTISLESNLFRIIELSVVSGRPPLLDIIVAQPLDDDSSAVLPKGSSHLDGITAISD